MNLLRLSLLLIFLPTFSYAQVLENFRVALDVVEKSQRAMGKPFNSIIINCKGAVHSLTHSELPEKTTDMTLEETYGYFRSENVHYLFGQIQNASSTYQRAGIAKEDSLYEKGYYAQSIKKSSAEKFKFEVMSALPQLILQQALDNRKSLRYLGRQQLHEVISFAEPSGETITVFVNSSTLMVEKIQRLVYSHIYGDSSFETLFQDFRTVEGIQIPETRLDYEFGLLERKVNYLDPVLNVMPDSTTLKIRWTPKYFRKTIPVKSKTGPQFEFVNIAQGLILIKINSHNNKIMIGEFADHIAVFEAPQSIELHHALQNELANRFPDKPIKRIFVTHHHPDHAGGIRAYSNSPATLVTTAGNKPYFEKLLATQHLLGNSLQSEPTPTLQLNFVPLGGMQKFSDKQNEVVAFEIGSSAKHTDEHLAFYFPKAKVLWTGDLLFFDTKETVYPANSRTRSIAELIETKKLKVDRIYTSWPLHGQKEFGTVEFLKKLTEAK